MNKKRRALFLDRDGVINVDHGYVYQPEQFEFIEGIFELCQYAVQREYLIFVVTNQAGIGRGYYTEQKFHELTRWMCEEFSKRNINIKHVYFCPYHEEYGVGEYKKHSIDRKPEPGMILQAAKEFDIDLANSVLVGDKETDIQAGIAAGIDCNLLYYNVVKVKNKKKSSASASAIVINKLTQVKSFLSIECISSDLI